MKAGTAMLNCVDCGYTGDVFRVCVAGISQGAFTFAAVCPRCRSRKVKFLPGAHETDIRMGIAVNKAGADAEPGQYGKTGKYRIITGRVFS